MVIGRVCDLEGWKTGQKQKKACAWHWISGHMVDKGTRAVQPGFLQRARFYPVSASSEVGCFKAFWDPWGSIGKSRDGVWAELVERSAHWRLQTSVSRLSTRRLFTPQGSSGMEQKCVADTKTWAALKFDQLSDQQLAIYCLPRATSRRMPALLARACSRHRAPLLPVQERRDERGATAAKKSGSARLRLRHRRPTARGLSCGPPAGAETMLAAVEREQRGAGEVWRAYQKDEAALVRLGTLPHDPLRDLPKGEEIYVPYTVFGYLIPRLTLLAVGNDVAVGKIQGLRAPSWCTNSKVPRSTVTYAALARPKRSQGCAPCAWCSALLPAVRVIVASEGNIVGTSGAGRGGPSRGTRGSRSLTVDIVAVTNEYIGLCISNLSVRARAREGGYRKQKQYQFNQSMPRGHAAQEKSGLPIFSQYPPNILPISSQYNVYWPNINQRLLRPHSANILPIQHILATYWLPSIWPKLRCDGVPVIDNGYGRKNSGGLFKSYGKSPNVP
ncbi:hypothetical protein B0H14DRAFT_2616664 [Mycena olivaceomarginata]|nr:hypothetical protein B0H14DRAFT_2616664 [Mycena olivaceomarginata]